MPIRYSTRDSSGATRLRSASASCILTAHLIASEPEGITARKKSPGVPTVLPLNSSTTPESSLRHSMIAVTANSLSLSSRRLNPTASAARTVARIRLASRLEVDTAAVASRYRPRDKPSQEQLRHNPTASIGPIAIAHKPISKLFQTSSCRLHQRLCADIGLALPYCRMVDRAPE